MPSSTGSRVTRLAQSFLRCAETTAWQATAWAASIASCVRGRLAPICTTSPTSHPAHLSTPHTSPPAWQTAATALPESAASCTSVWGARAGVCVASPEAVASRPPRLSTPPHQLSTHPLAAPRRCSAQCSSSSASPRYLMSPRRHPFLPYVAPHLSHISHFNSCFSGFSFFAHPPISPICRTPLFPYLTFESVFLSFAHRTHFSHMSHPTCPTSHLFILFFQDDLPPRFHALQVC